MIVPHSGKAAVQFAFPWLYIQVAAGIAGLVLIALLLFTAAYQRMSNRMPELDRLQVINVNQSQAIEGLAREAEGVRRRLDEVQALEQQVRRMMQLDQAPNAGRPQSLLNLPFGADGGVGGPETLGDAVPPRAAQGVPGGAGEPGSAPQRPPGESAAAAPAGGDAVKDLNGGLASAQKLPGSERERVRYALAVFRQAQHETATLVNSLQQLRAAVAEKQRYLAARPDGLPVAGTLTSTFGYRNSPTRAGVEFHAGTDLAAPYGAPVVATGAGVVTFAGYDGEYGLKVVVDHGYGYLTVYGHNSENLVGPGDRVTRGQVIAQVGSTGRSTGPHVHYEIWLNGRRVDPLESLD